MELGVTWMEIFLFGKNPIGFWARFLGAKKLCEFCFFRRISWASPQHCLEHKLVEDFLDGTLPEFNMQPENGILE